jgi:hypothetical protein
VPSATRVSLVSTAKFSSMAQAPCLLPSSSSWTRARTVQHAWRAHRMRGGRNLYKGESSKLLTDSVVKAALHSNAVATAAAATKGWKVSRAMGRLGARAQRRILRLCGRNEGRTAPDEVRV